MKTLDLALWAMIVAAAGLPPALAGEGERSLRFRPAANGEFEFDTGVLRGVLRPGGRSLGLSSLVHIPSGKSISRGYGIFSHYRVFTSNRRYGPGAWDIPSDARLREDGSIEARWPAAEERPFEMRVTYRWSAPATLDVETAVSARIDLPDFESFLASYFAPPFTTSMVYVKAPSGAGGKAGFMTAEEANGAWQMFPRNRDVLRIVQDGRWKIPPNPVDWRILRDLGQPLAIRREAQPGITAIMMAPERDCFAVATPQQTDNHYSTYLALFGRTIKAGKTARARARLVIAVSADDEQAVELYRMYVRELRGELPAGGR